MKAPPGRGGKGAASGTRTRGAASGSTRARLLLAGDIGGTKTNIALFEARPRGVRLVEVERFASHEHAGLQDIVGAFLSAHRAKLAAAAFGIAGPVVQRRSHTTNLPWVVDARSLSRRLGVPVELVNDLAATAFAIPEIAPRNLATLNEGAAARDGNLAFVAAGTGLGEAFVLRETGRFLVGASEGGHADYAPRTDEEIGLLRFLRARFGRVSIERVLSGPGLVNVDDFLASQDRPAGDGRLPAEEGGRPARGGARPSGPSREDGVEDRAASISSSGLSGASPRAARALRLFASAYGAETGNLALKTLATGGVFLGGGIAPKILPALRDGAFLEAFLDKGRFRDLLARIPVRVILDDRAALMGAARVARSLTKL